MDFSAYPTYSNYRTLHRTNPPQHGYDVWALQVALEFRLSLPLDADGYLGDETAKQIWRFQELANIVEDGLAGGQTQQRLALYIARKTVGGTAVPYLLMRGQIEHESSFRLGCHSPQREDGTYDAGVCQRNTEHVPAQSGYDPIVAIRALVTAVEKAFVSYEGVAPNKRRWGLAAGSWNAPAFANYLAREEGATINAGECANPSDASRALLEDYIASVTAYL